MHIFCKSQMKIDFCLVVKYEALLNFKNLIDINFEAIEELVTRKRETVVISVVDEFKMRRNPSTGHIITTTESKDYKIVFDKRVISEGLKMFPYGM